jgi:RES domain-containing protein
VILTACGSLPPTPENSYWFRCIRPAYFPTALSSAHTRKTATRFNPGPLLSPADQFAALYLSDSSSAALFEVGAMLGSPRPGRNVSHPGMAVVTLNVHVILYNVFDLTDVTSAQVLGTNAQELTGDWENYQVRDHTTSVSQPVGIAPTQELGMALFKAGVEGFRTISARVPYQKVLIVFPDNLGSRSSLTFSDPSGTYSHRIP